MKSNSTSRLFLGVDGGQSHTEALIADEAGRVVGRGHGGPSNHAEQPGGRERLRNAVIDSVGEALKSKTFPVFASAHFGMTGGADFKEEIIASVVTAENLTVGHDAPSALFGATAGEPGVVVIAGTGSVVFGMNGSGRSERAGGLGYLFSDEGSGFWLAAQTIRLAIKEQDGLMEPCGLEAMVKSHFGFGSIRELTSAYYNGKVSRDTIAGLARPVQEAAKLGNPVLAEQVRFGAGVLAAEVGAVAARLGFRDDFPVAGVGGMFFGELMRRYFTEALTEAVPQANFIEPRFGPAAGALLIAFRQANVSIDSELLENLQSSLS